MNEVRIEALLRAHGLATAKSLGQNFLRDEAVLRRIAAAAAGRYIFEIGAGAGALTALLSAEAERAVTVELDRRLEPLLRETVTAKNHTFIWSDVLKTDLSAVCAAQFGGARCTVAGNLPYYITGDILFWLLRQTACWERAVIMVQREAADRFLAAPGCKEYRAATAALRALCTVERLFDVPPDRFYPAPHVHSTVLALTPLQNAPEGFLAFVRACFAARRKMTAASPAVQRFMKTDRAGVERVLAAAGLPPTCRAELWTPETFLRVFAQIHAKNSENI